MNVLEYTETKKYSCVDKFGVFVLGISQIIIIGKKFQQGTESNILYNLSTNSKNLEDIQQAKTIYF